MDDTDYPRVSDPEVLLHDLHFPCLQKLSDAALDEHLAALQRDQAGDGPLRAAAAERADIELEKAIRGQGARDRVHDLAGPRAACSGLAYPGRDPNDLDHDLGRKPDPELPDNSPDPGDDLGVEP